MKTKIITRDNNIDETTTVIVGLSGGVDSAVAAYLLKEQGAKVIGMTMVQCDNMDEAISDAKKIAEHLKIEHIIRDERDRFTKEVKEYFANEYLCGRTPNPCVKCNRAVKWAALLDAMKECGADYIATGHYAEPIMLDNGNGNCRYSLRKNPGPKDQTYALCMLTQEELSHTVMPLAGMDKEKVRLIADTAGLPVATKPDSQDICFVPDGDYATVLGTIRPDSFANQAGKACEGAFVDEAGNILGTHKGITHYTIGQRKGLGLSLNKPAYVKALRVKTNEVVISTEGDVYGNELICSNINPIAIKQFADGDCLTAKIRYAGNPAPCTVYKDAGDGKLRVVFEKPVRAITPGQACVFYEDDILFGGAIIEKDASD